MRWYWLIIGLVCLTGCNGENRQESSPSVTSRAVPMYGPVSQQQTTGTQAESASARLDRDEELIAYEENLTYAQVRLNFAHKREKLARDRMKLLNQDEDASWWDTFWTQDKLDKAVEEVRAAEDEVLLCEQAFKRAQSE